MTRVAVVGLGYFSRFHLDAWLARPDCTLTMVADADHRRAQDVAARTGARAMPDPAALIEAGGFDILDLVVPPAAQADLIDAALAPGRVIVCQKPFCRSLAEAQRVVAAAEASDTTLVVHENFRFQPWYRALKSFLETEPFGPVWQADFALRPGDGRGPDAYLDRQPAFRSMPQFLVRETGVHFFDVFRWLFGPVTRVFADLRRLNPAVAGEDEGLVILTHKSGTRSVLSGNRLADHASDHPRRTMGDMRIDGAGGGIRLDGAGRLWVRRFQEVTETELPVAPWDDSSFGGGCVAALIDHVVAAARGDGAFENLAADYLDVLRICEAAYTSARTGRQIEVG